MHTIIELKNARIYQDQHLVLDDVSITLKNGEFAYLIGNTGTGKTSLLRALYADIKLNGGTGTVAGFELNSIRRSKIPLLRRKLGIVFQDFQLLTDRSVNENLLFVMRATGWKEKEKIKSRIEEVLEKVGLANKDYKMPHELSGGEQQRVAIARALINRPDIILADEPTGNLDPEISANILELLFEISKSGKAVLMASHDYALIQKYPARTLKCENGTIKEQAFTSVA